MSTLTGLFLFMAMKGTTPASTKTENKKYDNSIHKKFG
jgi:hypothetical protein